MSNKVTNQTIKETSLMIGDMNGVSACRSCTESYCCSYQTEIGITSSEFDDIEHLVTPVHVQRAKHEVKRLAKQEEKWRKEYEEMYRL